MFAQDMNNPWTYIIIVATLGLIGFFLREFFQARRKEKLVRRDQDKIYKWLMSEFRGRKDFDFRTTKAISSATHLSEDRVRKVAVIDTRIHKSTGPNDDRWTVKGKPFV